MKTCRSNSWAAEKKTEWWSFHFRQKSWSAIVFCNHKESSHKEPSHKNHKESSPPCFGIACLVAVIVFTRHNSGNMNSWHPWNSRKIHQPLYNFVVNTTLQCTFGRHYLKLNWKVIFNIFAKSQFESLYSWRTTGWAARQNYPALSSLLRFGGKTVHGRYLDIGTL